MCLDARKGDMVEIVGQGENAFQAVRSLATIMENKEALTLCDEVRSQKTMSRVEGEQYIPMRVSNH